VAERGGSGVAAIAPEMRGGGQLPAGFQAAMEVVVVVEFVEWNGSRSIDRGPRMDRDGAALKDFARPTRVSAACFVAVRGGGFCIFIFKKLKDRIIY
jgi:hypothetical protein